MLWGRSRLRPGIAVAVCAVAAAALSSVAGAVDQVFTVGQDQPMGVVLNDGESLDNAARISDDGGPIAIVVDGTANVANIVNRATGRIVNSTDLAIYVDGTVGSFINRGEVSGFNNAVVIGGNVGSFLNESLITSVDFEAVVLGGVTNNFTNSGRIEGFDGVAAFEVGTLTNHAGASIIGNGVCGGFPCGVAINALTIDVLDNAGTIAGGSAGAMLMDARIVRNSGRISGGEQGLAVGVPYVPIAVPGVTTDIVNFASGVIEATEPSGCGCFPTVGLSFVNGTLNNMGTIRGGIGVAIVGDGTTGVVVTNSGKIEGVAPVTTLGTHNVTIAMLFDTFDFRDPYDPDANNMGLARDDTLVLLPGSHILGAVDYANGVDTLDLRQYQGNQALLNYNLEQVLAGPAIIGQLTSGAMTFVVTVDDTALKTATPTQFNSFTKSVFSSIRGATGGSPAGTASAPLAYAPSSSATPAGQAASDLAGVEDVANDGKVWVGSFGDLARDDSALRAFSQQLGGVVFGAHAALDKSTRLGIVVSGGSSVYATDLQTQTVRGTLGALGLYGDADLGMVTADFALLGGAAANHSERNLTGFFGNETAIADYAGWFLSPALGLGIPLFALEAVEAQADIRVRYLGGQTGAYTETGSSMNLSVAAQTVSLAEARAGFTATAEIDALTLSATIGALVQSNMGGSTTGLAVSSPMGSIPLTSTTPGTTTTGLYGGASLDLALGANARVTATAGAEIRTDGFRSVGGSVNLGGTF